jgi:hypothetical protein
VHEQREGDPGAEGRREDHQQRQTVPGEVEGGIARIGPGHRLQQGRRPLEGVEVERECRQGEETHEPLHRAQRPDRIATGRPERIQYAPIARPRMNALSISSKACVALESTSESIRVQAIS